MLENPSDRSIVGISNIWNLTNNAGKIQVYKQTSDSFALPSKPLVAGSHSRSRIGPRNVIPCEMGAAHMGPSPVSTSNVASVHLTIDAILFDDGELVGPEKNHLAVAIMTRKKMAKLILEAAHTARTENMPINDALLRHMPVDNVHQSMTQDELTERNLSQTIYSHYADLARRGGDGVVQFLQSLPEPVTIYTRGK
jgi:hypothetical protein